MNERLRIEELEATLRQVEGVLTELKAPFEILRIVRYALSRSVIPGTNIPDANTPPY